MMDATISYYEENACSYYGQTVNADMTASLERFVKYLPSNGMVLDFGCGSGRDTKYFLQRGFQVEAIDGSKELAEHARADTGLSVKCMRFQELSEVERYDGIWACASILHLDKKELAEVFRRMKVALKPGGIIYTSFKYGEFEGMHGERYFTDFTEDGFKEFIDSMDGLYISEEWISEDVRPDRAGEKWLNVIVGGFIA